jgi:uncharacterized protein (DUF983 family)
MSEPGSRDLPPTSRRTGQVANSEKPASVATVLKRGLRAKCPQCGRGKIFYGWNKVVDACPLCGCELERRGGESWFFTYMSTAFLTGIIILFMLLFRMPSLFLQITVVIAAWFLMIVLTLPVRKSIGIAIDYLVDLRSI